MVLLDFWEIFFFFGLYVGILVTPLGGGCVCVGGVGVGVGGVIPQFEFRNFEYKLD